MGYHWAMAARQGDTGSDANAVRPHAPQREKAESGRCETDGGNLEPYVARDTEAAHGTNARHAYFAFNRTSTTFSPE